MIWEIVQTLIYSQALFDENQDYRGIFEIVIGLILILLLFKRLLNVLRYIINTTRMLIFRGREDIDTEKSSY